MQNITEISTDQLVQQFSMATPLLAGQTTILYVSTCPTAKSVFMGQDAEVPQKHHGLR